MIITLHWWFLPILLVCCGLYFGRSSGDYDFASPMIALCFYIAAIFICAGFLIGKIA